MASNGSQPKGKIKIAILISGRGSNMKAIIQACADKKFPAEISLILSNKPDAEGLNFAKSQNIPTTIINHKDFSNNSSPRLEFDQAMDREITKHNIDLICLAGFMRLLSEWFVTKWQNRLINIHPSLLPDFKGANAVADALKSQAKFSGCSVHYVTKEMDSGPIIKQARVEINEDDDFSSLSKKILNYEHKIYPQAIAEICHKILK